MDFGRAIRALKDGKSVFRKGWNGKNMFVYLSQPVDDNFEPYLVLFTAQQRHQPGWLASQADMLATDWTVVER